MGMRFDDRPRADHGYVREDDWGEYVQCRVVEDTPMTTVSLVPDPEQPGDLLWQCDACGDTID